MPTMLTIRDEAADGGTLHEFALEVPTERLTIRELIRSRIYQEVQDYNFRQPEFFVGLVQPGDAERTLDGYKIPNARHIDWKLQFKKAIVAFESSFILILVDDQQAESLDQEIVLGKGTSVTFLRLTPLAGG